jgi:hypothetical protein
MAQDLQFQLITNGRGYGEFESKMVNLFGRSIVIVDLDNEKPVEEPDMLTLHDHGAVSITRHVEQSIAVSGGYSKITSIYHSPLLRSIDLSSDVPFANLEFLKLGDLYYVAKMFEEASDCYDHVTKKLGVPVSPLADADGSRWWARERAQFLRAQLFPSAQPVWSADPKEFDAPLLKKLLAWFVEKLGDLKWHKSILEIDAKLRLHASESEELCQLESIGVLCSFWDDWILEEREIGADHQSSGSERWQDKVEMETGLSVAECLLTFSTMIMSTVNQRRPWFSVPEEENPRSLRSRVSETIASYLGLSDEELTTAYRRAFERIKSENGLPRSGPATRSDKRVRSLARYFVEEFCAPRLHLLALALQEHVKSRPCPEARTVDNSNTQTTPKEEQDHVKSGPCPEARTVDNSNTQTTPKEEPAPVPSKTKVPKTSEPTVGVVTYTETSAFSVSASSGGRSLVSDFSSFASTTQRSNARDYLGIIREQMEDSDPPTEGSDEADW